MPNMSGYTYGLVLRKAFDWINSKQTINTNIVQNECLDTYIMPVVEPQINKFGKVERRF